MGAFLEKPKTEKYNESRSGAGLRYGLSSMQGWRLEMEDAHSAVIGIPDIADNVSWFAVFDGHAGSRVSYHCSHHLLESISCSDEFRDCLKRENELSEDELMEKVKAGILQGFLSLDEKLRYLFFFQCTKYFFEYRIRKYHRNVSTISNCRSENILKT